MKPEEIDWQLNYSLERDTPVNIYRDECEPSHGGLGGCVVAIFQAFVLLNVVSDRIRLDGWSLLRRSDITEVDTERSDFVEKVMRFRALSARFPEGIETESLRAFLESVGEHYPLVTIHQEQLDDESCWIGKFIQCDDSSVTLQLIDPSGAWVENQMYELQTITRVEFGADYENALALAAGLIHE